MRYLVLYEAYNDYIDQGSLNKVFDIDDDWVLKMPRTIKEVGKNGFLDSAILADEFDKHISFLKRYPQIFPITKRLNKTRASVEKLDTDLAIKEIVHIYNLLKDRILKERHSENNEAFKEYLSKHLIGTIYKSDKLFSILGEESNDPICKKWMDFIILLKTTIPTKELEHPLDLHYKNFGIDKKGNIKLLDF